MNPAVWTLRLGLLATVTVFGIIVLRPSNAEHTSADRAWPDGIGALGRVEPASRILRLGPAPGQSGARIARLLVEEGDHVDAGALLAEFSDAVLKDAGARTAESQLAQARARLQRTRAGGRPSEVEAQQARIEALRQAELSALRDAERAERLAQGAVGAPAAAERARALANRASAERAEAQAVLASLSAPRPEDTALAEAEVAAAEAALEFSMAEAGLSRLRAPIGGTVIRIITRPGEAAGPDGVLELADLTRIDIVADVHETDLPRLRLGASAEVQVPGETAPLATVVRAIGWQVRRVAQGNADPVAAIDARTVEVRLAVEDAAVPLLVRRSNMQVQVSIRP